MQLVVDIICPVSCCPHLSDFHLGPFAPACSSIASEDHHQDQKGEAGGGEELHNLLSQAVGKLLHSLPEIPWALQKAHP